MRISFFILLNIISFPLYALPFGTFDPRSVAMGGTGVASATAANASYYNPALLSRYDDYKEEADNQRLISPTVNVHAANVLVEIDEFNQNADDELTAAINAYNNAPTDVNAQNGVLSTSTTLNNDLNSVSEAPVYLDVNVGFVIGIPTKGQGGAFMFNRRFVGDGNVNYSSSDQQLVNAFIETMQFISTNGANGSIHNEIFVNNQPNANLDNLDPALIDQLTSDATVRAVDITEIGMSMSWEVDWFNTEFSFGFTPKGMRVATYDLAANATDTNFSDNERIEHDWDFNLDFGLAKEFSRQWTAGLVVKNMIPKKYETSLGNSISFEPMVRIGSAYYSRYGTYTADLDLTENKPIGTGGKTRVLGIGGEWAFRWSVVRAGYNKDFGSDPVSSSGLFSGGIRFNVGRGFYDFTYALSSQEEAAAFQIGLQF